MLFRSGEFKHRNDVVFAFVGEGTVKKDMEVYVKENNLDNVVFIPYQDKKDLIYSLNAGDVHWVVNSKGIKGISVPSKLYGVMAAGKPIIGVLEEGSEGRLIVEEAGCGLCTEPGNYKGVYNIIKKFIDNKDSIDEMGIKGRKYLETNLTKSVSINKYKSEILSLDVKMSN